MGEEMKHERPATLERIDELLKDGWQVWATAGGRTMRVLMVDGDRIVIENEWDAQTFMLPFSTDGVTYDAFSYAPDPKPKPLPSWFVRGFARAVAWMAD